MALVLTTWWGGPDFSNAFSITCCCLDYHPTRHPIFGFNALQDSNRSILLSSCSIGHNNLFKHKRKRDRDRSYVLFRNLIGGQSSSPVELVKIEGCVL